LAVLSNFWSFPNIIPLAKLSRHKEGHLDLPKSFDFTAHKVLLDKTVTLQDSDISHYLMKSYLTH